MGTPIECAKVIAFLASDAARVGQTIEANGGQLMLWNWKLVEAWSFNEKSSRAEKAKSRVSACFQGTAFLHRRHGNPGSRASRFGHLARNRDCTGHAGSPSENKTHSKQLRTRHGHCL